jgi:hypothetical protein
VRLWIQQTRHPLAGPLPGACQATANPGAVAGEMDTSGAAQLHDSAMICQLGGHLSVAVLGEVWICSSCGRECRGCWAATPRRAWVICGVQCINCCVLSSCLVFLSSSPPPAGGHAAVYGPRGHQAAGATL